MINRIKQSINRVVNYDYFIINEMAKIGIFGQYSIVIETNDHPPAHFHIKINDKPVTRIQIPRTLPARTYDLVYMKDETRLSSKVEKDLIKWMGTLDLAYSDTTNLADLQKAWNNLHYDNKVKWN